MYTYMHMYIYIYIYIHIGRCPRPPPRRGARWLSAACPPPWRAARYSAARPDILAIFCPFGLFCEIVSSLLSLQNHQEQPSICFRRR